MNCVESASTPVGHVVTSLPPSHAPQGGSTHVHDPQVVIVSSPVLPHRMGGQSASFCVLFAVGIYMYMYITSGGIVELYCCALDRDSTIWHDMYCALWTEVDLSYLHTYTHICTCTYYSVQR